MKYFIVKKDTPLWLKGAILKPTDTENGYNAISDLWDANEKINNEYLTATIIESQPEWFERVYETSILGKAKFLTKEKAREFYNQTFKKENE